MGERLANARFTVRYIGRYTKRPVLAQTRIKKYDGQLVTFEYHDKAVGEHKLVTMPVEQFMTRLVRHIPDKHFRQIRYYGLYASRGKKGNLNKAMVILRLSQKKRIAPLNWQQRRKLQRGFDPLVCGHCQSELKLVKLVYCSRDGPMQEVSFE